jgi:hypothetical protein
MVNLFPVILGLHVPFRVDPGRGSIPLKQSWIPAIAGMTNEKYDFLEFKSIKYVISVSKNR